MKNRKIITGVAGLALALSYLSAPAVEAARSYDWNRAQNQRQVNAAFNVKMHRIHYYDTRGRKYREDRVYIDLNTGRKTWEHDVPRNRW